MRARALPRSGWLIAALALGGHLALILALGVQAPGAVDAGINPAAATRVMQVLLQHAAANLADVPAAAPEPPAPALPSLVAIPAPAPFAPAPLLPVIGIAPPHYYGPAELTEKPHVIHDVAPDVSNLTLPAGAPQALILRLLISEDGDVDRVKIERGEMAEDLERAVLDAYANLKFSPGKVDGREVKSQMIIEVKFENVPGGAPLAGGK
jgi:TonB family protein